MSRKTERIRKPRILIPYTPRTGERGEEQEFFITLRPEANGVAAESSLLKTVRNNPIYKNNVSFVYLANISGDYIINHRIVEQHYHLKISYARHGTSLFTPFMKDVFQDFFQIPFWEAEISGSFQALSRLGCSEDELFRIRVKRKDMIEINGQNIKRIGDIFVVNYDIPAILHKNSHVTDIAVMIFRSTLGSDDFAEMIREMGENLVKEGILHPDLPISRIFHYSKSPFEFLLDASGYLLKSDFTPYPLGNMDFPRFLNSRGLPLKIIEGVLKYPLLSYRSPAGGLVERDIFQYTFGNTFEASYRKLISASGQCYIA